LHDEPQIALPLFCEARAFDEIFEWSRFFFASHRARRGFAADLFLYLLIVLLLMPDSGKGADEMFEVGDIVVYPIHGVARVAAIQKERIGGAEQMCYILETEIRTGNHRPVIKLPVDKAESNRVRKIVDEAEVSKVIDILKNRSLRTDSVTWNKRHREYQEKMRSGSIFQAAEVFRDLTLLKETKDLSHGERRLFDQARNLLIKELSIAKRTDEGEIERTIAKIFSESEEFF
jgi:CarD family transcriptional regulator